MTWSRMQRQPTQKEPGAIEIACNARTPRLQAGMSLILRGAMLPPLPFLRAGARIDALLGEGDNAGKLRIEHGTEFRLFIIGKSGASGTLMTRGLPMPPGLPPKTHRSIAVPFECGDGWIEITLPAWLRSPEAENEAEAEHIAAPAPEAPRTPAAAFAAAGRTSIMDRVSDPAAALRGRR